MQQILYNKLCQPKYLDEIDLCQLSWVFGCEVAMRQDMHNSLELINVSVCHLCNTILTVDLQQSKSGCKSEFMPYQTVNVNSGKRAPVYANHFR